MKTKVELLEVIVRKQDERIRLLTDFIKLVDEDETIKNSFLPYCSIKDKLRRNNIEITEALLKSRLSKAGEEKMNELVKAYSDLVTEIDKHKGTTLKEVKLRNKIANLKLEIR